MSGLLGLGAAVSGTALAQPAPEAAAPAQPPAEAAGPRVGGLLGMFTDALGDVELRPEQQQHLGSLLDSASDRHAAMFDSNRALMAALGEQIRIGVVSREALGVQLSSFADAWAAAHAGDLEAISALHRLLDAGQRADLAATLRARIDENDDFDAAAFVEGLSEQLDLTAEQGDRVRGALEDHQKALEADAAAAASRDRLQGMLAAFPDEQFDVQQFAPDEGARAQAGRVAGDMIDLTGDIVAVLDEGQRARLAQLVTAQAAGDAPADQGGDGLGTSQQAIGWGGGWGSGWSRGSGYGYGQPGYGYPGGGGYYGYPYGYASPYCAVGPYGYRCSYSSSSGYAYGQPYSAYPFGQSWGWGW